MRHFVEELEQLKRMGERGRELAITSYTWTKCAERYLEVFRNCTNANAPTS